MLKAVIFDMDGVIIDSEPLHAKAAVITAKKFGIQVTIAYCYQFIGSTTSYLFETLIKDKNVELTVEELLEAYEQVKLQLIKEDGYPPLPGVIDLIKDLYKHGITLAIASSSTLNEIKSVTKSLGITKYFDKLISGTSVPNSKPSPDVFLLALKELGMNARDCIIIEDSMNGVIAADAASIACIGLLNPNSGKQDLSKASVLIENFEGIDHHYISDVLRRYHGEPVTIANTKRLIIRELAVSDIKDMYQIYQSQEVTEFVEDMNEYLDVEIEKHKAYIKNVYNFYGYGLWGVFSKDTKTLIGRSGIQNSMIDGKSEIELSYLLDINHWGYGYAIECTHAILNYAANVLQIPRVVAVIDKLNTRSIKVAERTGLIYEKDIVYNGRHCKLYSKNLLKSDNYLKATNKVQTEYANHPNEVYSKQYDYKNK
jgi:haloacid dehalogenase superfamily, subfamily IA, variant 3 with third motif having DD or ED/haloacid dehalogenase superfamily, subfamily IA, variant 1 with third motif having Dx(3-4)D or Dx(3-4)E